MRSTAARSSSSSTTRPPPRPPPQTFDARSGNCLSLVLMTAALAHELQVCRCATRAPTSKRRGAATATCCSPAATSTSPSAGACSTPARCATQPDGRSTSCRPTRSAACACATSTRATVLAMYANNRAAEALARRQARRRLRLGGRGVRQDPTFMSSYNTLGVVYLRHGNLAQAERVFEHILERDPKNTRALANLAETYTRQDAAGRRRGDAHPAGGDRVGAAVPLLQPRPGDAARQSDWRTARDFFAREVARADYYHEFHFWLGLADWRSATSRARHASTCSWRWTTAPPAASTTSTPPSWPGCSRGRSPSRPSRPGARRRRALPARGGAMHDDDLGTARARWFATRSPRAASRSPRCSRRCARCRASSSSPPGAALSRLRRHAAADRGRADDLAALHRRPDARGCGHPPGRPRARDRRRLGLCQRAREPARRPRRSRSSATPAWPSWRASGWRASATPTSTSTAPTAAAAGRTARRSTRSWSRRGAARAGAAAPPARRRRPAGHAGGTRARHQRLVLVTRAGDAFLESDLGGVVFVPLIGAHGWPERGEP